MPGSSAKAIPANRLPVSETVQPKGREREREREGYIYICYHIYTYIYIKTCICIHTMLYGCMPIYRDISGYKGYDLKKRGYAT